MARDVPGLVHRAVDVAAHDAVQVPPPDDEAERDATLVHPLGVVRRPGDRVRDARVDAQGAQEGAGVPDPRGVAAEEHGEPDDAEERDADVAEAALPGPIGEVTEADRQHGGRRVRRDRKELRLRLRVPQVVDDRGQEEGEGVQRPVGAHVDDGGQPGLPILDWGPEIRHLEGFVLGTRLLVRLQPADDPRPVGIRQESSLIREVVHHPEGGDPDEHSQDAFEDEDPRPAALTAHAFHQPDGGRQETTERAGHGRRGEENGHPDPKLRTLVPAGKVVADPGEETGLGETEEPPSSHQAGVVVR